MLHVTSCCVFGERARVIGDWERDCKRSVANITMLSCVVFIVLAQVLASITRQFFLHRHFFFTVGVVHKARTFGKKGF